MFFKYGQKGNVILFIYPMILFIRAKGDEIYLGRILDKPVKVNIIH